ncbi:YdcF family protein [Brachybacterium sp. DNPG3]
MLSSLIITAAWWGVFALSFRKDRRRVRNGVLVLMALNSSLTTLLQLIAEALPVGGAVVLALMVLVVVGVLALALFLIGNGLTMARREGRSLGNALSLLAGLAMLAAPAASAALVTTTNPAALGLGVLLALVSLHLGLAFLVFLAASLLYQRFPRRMPATGVIVLGSGLVRGRVTRLLAGRLDRAVAAREELAARGVDALLVPSGGRGADEDRPEGEAMAEYLVDEAGVPADRVVAETEAATTEENLRLSHRILDASGRTGPYLIATSRYHAFRAGLLARRLGYDDEAVGGPTRFYYVPSATLREFIAVVSYRRAWFFGLLAPSLAVTALIVRAAVLAS